MKWIDMRGGISVQNGPDIINFILLALVGTVGWLARNAFISVKDDQKALWDRINSNLLPRTEFQMHRDYSEQKLDAVDKKLDMMASKLDEHFTWELNRERKYNSDKR